MRHSGVLPGISLYKNRKINRHALHFVGGIFSSEAISSLFLRGTGFFCPDSAPCGHSARSGRALLSPCRALLSPRRAMSSPCRALFSPRRALLSPRRALFSPRRALLSPCRALLSPRRAMSSPCRALFSPRRALLSPRRALFSPRRALLSPCRALLSPRRATAPRVCLRSKHTPVEKKSGSHRPPDSSLGYLLRITSPEPSG